MKDDQKQKMVILQQPGTAIAPDDQAKGEAELFLLTQAKGTEMIAPQLMNRIKGHLVRKNIDPLDDREELSVGLYQSKKVPLKGSVHISSGRTISREDINKLFRRIRFA